MSFDERMAARLADQKIEELGIRSLPIDARAIAEQSDIVVEPMPEDVSDISGALTRSGNQFGILYATNIESAGRQRFSIAHELGHYFIPDHAERLLAEGRHESRADFRSNDPFERQADHFAAHLLLPTRLCQKLVASSADVGFRVVEELADAAAVSVTAAALRYTHLTPNPVAVVVSSAGVVDYCFASAALKDQIRNAWLRPGVPIPGSRTYTTATAIVHAELTSPTARPRKREAQTRWCEWFDTSDRSDVFEEVVHLKSYGKVLTVLSMDEELSEPEEQDDG